MVDLYSFTDLHVSSESDNCKNYIVALLVPQAVDLWLDSTTDSITANWKRQPCDTLDNKAHITGYVVKLTGHGRKSLISTLNLNK